MFERNCWKAPLRHAASRTLWCVKNVPSMRTLVSVAQVLALTASSYPSVTVSRRSPEFIISEPSGKTVLLSSFSGKVIIMEFLFIKSEHCLRVAETLNKLHGELGPRGFQPVGIVFDPPNTPNSSPPLITAFATYFKLTFPIGYTSKNSVDSYLGRASNEVLNIPQVVVIDRTGMIRAVSGGRGGDPRLEDENYLRHLIDSLLKEGGGVGSAKK